MSILSASRASTKPIRRPVVAELVLHINTVPYVLVLIAPGPDNTKAVRLVKHGNADTVYDVCRTNQGELRCDCPDFEVRSGDQVGYRCKHLTALVLVGLVEAPAVPAPAFVHVPDEFDEVKPVETVEPATLEISRVEPPARVVPAFDLGWHLSMNAVVEKRAAWLTSKPAEGVHSMDTPADPRDVVIIDEDGTPLETPREMAERHRAEHAAAVAELMDGTNPFLPTARQVESIHCCSPSEPMPCLGCSTHTFPEDFSGEDWRDDERYELGPETDPFDAWIRRQADAYGKIKTPRAAWLARKLADLADEAAFLDADSPDAFDDRREVCLDAARDAAEARQAARCR